MKYKCIYIDKECYMFTGECPLFIYGVYPNNMPCREGVIELDWIQTILYRELLNEHFTKDIIKL